MADGCHDSGRPLPYHWQAHSRTLADGCHEAGRPMPEHCHEHGSAIPELWQVVSRNMAEDCYTPTRTIAAPGHWTATSRAADLRPSLLYLKTSSRRSGRVMPELWQTHSRHIAKAWQASERGLALRW